MAASSTTRRGNGPGRGGTNPHLGSQGQGWGGPAKGASGSRIKPGDPDGIQAMANDPDILARKAARSAELKDHLYRLATKADRQETQLAAAVAWLNREEGTPIARSINTNMAVAEMTDAELVNYLRQTAEMNGDSGPGEVH